MSSPALDHPARNAVLPLAMLGGAMIIGLASLALTLLDVRIPGIRPLLAVAAMVTIPGIPLLVASRIGTLGVQVVLGVAISLSCWLLAAQLALGTGVWSPFAAQAALTAVALAATLVALATQRDDHVSERPVGNSVVASARHEGNEQ